MDRIRDIRPPGSPHAVHEQAPQVVKRLLAKTTPGPNGCVIWTGSVDRDNYGEIRVSGKYLRAHRALYQLLVAPVDGKTFVDHVCHNLDATCSGGRTCLHRRCINPQHLDTATNRENLLRSEVSVASLNLSKTHCWRGHPLSGSNLYVYRGRRCCRACVLIRGVQRRERKRATEAGRAQ